MIKQNRVRLETSTVCQLKCPTCPTAEGFVNAQLGSGFLKFDDFKKFIDNNPSISDIELSCRGEIFLNPDIINIIKYAYEKNVSVHARNGSNMNMMTEELAEALVKYHFKVILCAIDGADNDTYMIYRRRGNFDKVINNIKMINEYKRKYNSDYPKLMWQYVVFGHNEDSIERAREMANELGMHFFVKLSWEDFYGGEPFSPIKNKEKIRRLIGVADRNEFFQKYGVSHNRQCCENLWKQPQINYDGRMLGCNINNWDDFGNVFQDGFIPVFNNEKMNYARSMLMGKSPAREDIPCIHCPIYKEIKLTGQWISWKDLWVKQKLLLKYRSLTQKYTNRSR